MKKGLLVGVCVAAMLGVSTAARADYPVIDFANLTEWATSLADDAKTYGLQLQQYATQVKQYVGEELSWVKQASQYATQLQQYALETTQFVNFVHNPSLGTAMGFLSGAGG
jgi:conjugal transfer/entry exclusion protein